MRRILTLVLSLILACASPAIASDPTSIAGLELWLDASNASSITLVSGVVSQWNDLSGNNNKVTQATAADRPAETTVNGLNALTFDGTEQFLLAASTTGLPSGSGTPLTIFLVYQDTGTGYGIPFGYGVNSGTGSILYFSNAGAGLAFGSGNSYQAFNTPSPTGLHVLSGVFSGGTLHEGYAQWSDGTSLTDGAYTDGTSDIASGGPLAIGAIMGGGASWFLGTIAEVIVYSGALSTDDRETVEGELAWKWGDAANLPVGHPYASAPPAGWLNSTPSAIGNAAYPNGSIGRGKYSDGAQGNG